MSSKRLLSLIACATVASLLAAAPPKDSKNAKKPAAGVQTPGIQIPFASLKSDAEIQLEAAPTGAAFTTEALIAAGNTVQRIDAKSNKPGEAITGLNDACGGLLNGLSKLWVLNCGTKSLAKITLKPAKIDLTIETGAGTAVPALAASTDSIWLLSDDKSTLSRIDPKENKVVAEVRLAAACNSILFAETSLWVTCPSANRVLRIDPRTNLVDKRIEVPGKPISAAFGEASIWVLSQTDGKVAQIDPKTNKVTTTIELSIPNATGNVAFGDGSVWVSAPGFPITRIHPGTAKVVQQFAGEGGGQIYSGLGSVWLADAKAKKVIRFDPKRIAATLAD
jgi:DNA-binding beta-propeller fold protein YncE